MQQIDRLRRFGPQNVSHQDDYRWIAGESENIEHIVLADFLSAKCHQLIEHRFRIAQTAFCTARDRVRSRRLQRDLFFSSDELEMLRNEIIRDAVEIEPLTA